MKSKDRPSECSNCARYRKENARLKEAFLDADVESVRQSMQHKDEILELKDERLFAYRLHKDSKAGIRRLKAQHSLGSQSKKKMLEEVEGPVSNTQDRQLW